MTFEAKTLEEAYLAAAKAFECSVSELENITVVKNPKKGIFGFFSQNALIEVGMELPQKRSLESIETEEIVTSTTKEMSSADTVEEKLEESSVEELPKEEIVATEEKSSYAFEEVESFVEKIEEEINLLFAESCFELDKIEVSKFDFETVLIEFNGKDAALLIGKEGYRYNALSYMLFNWIHQKYGFKIRLEIAEFLRNQEDMMKKFLQPTIKEVEYKGKAKTKSLDGVLVHIAVDILRNCFPDKYVGVKQKRDGEKYIIVNEFLSKDG